MKYERSKEDAEMARTNFKIIQDDKGKVTMKWQKPEVNDPYSMGQNNGNISKKYFTSYYFSV